MAVTKLSNSGIKTGVLKYDSMLAGNAAYDPAATWLIASATGTGSSNTITFSSIPSTYTSLQIRFRAKDTFVADNGGQAYIQFNSDTTSSYNSHRIYGNGATVTASSQSGPSATATYSAPLSIARSGAAVNTNTISVGIIDIHDYANTSRNKTIRWFNGFDNNDTNGIVALASGLWRSTSAITSISIFSPSTAWTTNTRFALYGMKG